MESTYGDRDHAEADNLESELADIINDTVRRGGNIVIPTFAIDRAQELMYFFSKLVRADRIPKFTVFLDSPMALDATDIYKRYRHMLDEETQRMLAAGNHPFQFPGMHFVRSAAESRAINNRPGSSIIMAGAGMCTGGRIKHHLRLNISRPESTILFCGFQAEGTLGRDIIDGKSSVRIHGRPCDVKARIARIFGLSAHADRAGLTNWINCLNNPPQRIFLTHGELAAAESLASHLRTASSYDVHVPDYQSVIDLNS
jgi:metallo-beta-lactamase family protein